MGVLVEDDVGCGGDVGLLNDTRGAVLSVQVLQLYSSLFRRECFIRRWRIRIQDPSRQCLAPS